MTVNLYLRYIDSMTDTPKNSEIQATSPTKASNRYLDGILNVFNDPRFAQVYIDAVRIDPSLAAVRFIAEGIKVGAQKALGKGGNG